ncbi:uncharacterized protein L969DRAFT_94171 [Mixia osmundae IAM 14324]|uniref:Kinesin-like protein n=1 Tax=Mixia osmundae (strain CBS 9802 / IAM 14324 / JCM 22182 / KY 12970) TaxID=764103 RepID=G7DWB9_MIXOS|nr:uncharacterized protein L969DRAFT_94171 [Mixia osmundae IAM 14324]KEI40368.1 hypothetical protein L969DRAFT_94171 [Mixia osmundae IAM 14324]GAA94879.1 hypothetical protein E5Q_01534 [Mixia osmundae IAM 14324]
MNGPASSALARVAANGSVPGGPQSSTNGFMPKRPQVTSTSSYTGGESLPSSPKLAGSPLLPQGWQSPRLQVSRAGSEEKENHTQGDLAGSNGKSNGPSVYRTSILGEHNLQTPQRGPSSHRFSGVTPASALSAAASARPRAPLTAPEHSNVRVKAKISSEATPRRKVGVAGAERCDRPTSTATPVRTLSPQKSLLSLRSPGSGSFGQASVGLGISDTITAASLGPVSCAVTYGQDKRDAPRDRQDNVFVCVRMRPAASALVAQGQDNGEEAWAAECADGKISLKAAYARQGSSLHGSMLDRPETQFTYDAVVTSTNNEVVYREAGRQIILGAMEGFDGVIFAYGQTASGKTHTLTGTESNPGIIPRAVTEIFAYIRSQPEREFLLRASYLEIYNEALKDLLDPTTEGKVRIRQDENKRFFCSPLREEVVTAEHQVAELLKRGERNRHTSSTDFNARSSRSHSVFQMVIESRDVTSNAVVISQLSLIDLAGSEKATSQSERRMEGAFINKSLLTLEKVISALTETKARSHIPYRDSKLTSILQPSLSGEARVAVICTINPSLTAIEESKSTLKFAARVKRVEIRAERNEVYDEKALITKYQIQIAHLEAQLEESKSQETSAQSIKELQKQMADLQSLLVSSKTVDAKDQPVAPRAVSPVKQGAEPEAQKLLDELDRESERSALLRDEVDTLQTQNANLRADIERLEQSQPANSSSDRIRSLQEEVKQLQMIIEHDSRDVEAAVRHERRRADRERQTKEAEYDLLKAFSDRQRQTIDDLEKKMRQLEEIALRKLNSAIAVASGQQPLPRSETWLPSLLDESDDLTMNAASEDDSFDRNNLQMLTQDLRIG